MSQLMTRLDDFLPYLLSTASNASSDLIAREYKSRFGLKIPEWRVMAILGSRGASTQRDLVEQTLMDKVTVNRATKALVMRDLLRRSPNNADGRSHHLELTDTGRELYDRIMPAAEAIEQRIMTVLSDEEKQTLSDLLKRVRRSAEDIANG